jgi:ABC-type glutathione transport system ATPase component
MNDNVILGYRSPNSFCPRRKESFAIPGKDHVKAVNEVKLRSGKKLRHCGTGSVRRRWAYRPGFGTHLRAIWFQGEEITHIQDQKLKQYRRKVQMVFQDPASSLNPYHSIESILSLPLKIYESMGKKERRTKVAELLGAVHLPPEIMKRHPGSLSGGQKQRISLARALALTASSWMEPTSGPDVCSARFSISWRNSSRLWLTFIFITHDDHRETWRTGWRLYLGRIVEMAPVAMILNALGPY